jgi:hypothetical protein
MAYWEQGFHTSVEDEVQQGGLGCVVSVVSDCNFVAAQALRRA